MLYSSSVKAHGTFENMGEFLRKSKNFLEKGENPDKIEKLPRKSNFREV